jgi:hypothetical protein
MATRRQTVVNGDILTVEVDLEEGIMRWWLTDEDKEVQNNGEMDIEVYSDNSWLPYEETHRPERWMPRSLEPLIFRLLYRLGLKQTYDYKTQTY